MNFNGMTSVFKILSLIFCVLSLFIIHEVLSKHIDSTFDSIFYSFVINLMLLPTFGFIATGFPLEKLLPNSYYEDIKPQRIIKLFFMLRVDIFKRIVTFIPTKRISKTSFLQDVEREKQKSIKSEIAHLMPFFVILLISVALLAQKQYLFPATILLINIPINIFPIILQRYNRHRINKLFIKIKITKIL